MKKPDLEMIRDIINSQPAKTIFYVPNVATTAQVGLHRTKQILGELTKSGEVIELMVPRYRGDMLSQFAVPLGQELLWEEMQDPEDYIQIDPSDVEVCQGFCRK